MAFDVRTLDLTGSGSKGTRVLAIYETAVDNKAAVKGAGYFNSSASELARSAAMLVIATDATLIVKVSVAAGVVTIADMDAFI